MIIFLVLKAIQILNFKDDVSLLDGRYCNLNKVYKIFECLCKNDFSVLHVNIRSINKNIETFILFYSTLNCTFCVICFSETWATDSSICNDSNFQ